MESVIDDQPVILTAEIKNKIKFAIKSILIRTHSQNNKHEILDSSGRLNFACPYCGDSNDDDRKKRGNLFWDSLYYHCYNDGCAVNGKVTHRTIVQFFRDFSYNVTDDDHFTYLKYIKDHRVSTGELDNLEYNTLKKLDELSVLKEDFRKKMNLFYINESTYRIYPYLISRLLHHKLDYFLWDPRKKQLYILNTNHDASKIYGYQLRNLSENRQRQAKYLSFNISKIRDIMELETVMDETELDSINKLSLLFGISFLDLTQDFTIFEGPLDSMFMKNSIAICGLTKEPFDFDSIPTSRYLLDNDKGGTHKMIEKIQKNKKVFLWKKVLEKNKIGAEIKDLNDLIRHMYKYKLKINLNNYFSDDPYDILNIC